MTLLAPGLIFADDDDLAPDLVWLSQQRFAAVVGEDGKLYNAPELAIEVLSPGGANEARDRQHKRDLYARRGVLEYWIVDWRTRQVVIYRRENRHPHLAAPARLRLPGGPSLRRQPAKLPAPLKLPRAAGYAARP